ncbi:MAG: response regulator [Bradymonadia bacterium]
MRILLIDDEPDTSERLALYLGRDGHAVESLCWVESEETLRALLDDFRPDGVVLDFEMEPAGPQVLAWLQAFDPQIPVAFYTKYGASADHIHRMMTAGVRPSAIVTKREAAEDARQLLAVLGGRP